MIPKARLEELIAHLNSMNNPDNPDQLYAEVVDALTELLQYRWRDVKVELPDKVGWYDGSLLSQRGDQYEEPIYWTENGAWQDVDFDAIITHWKHQIPLPPLPEGS